MKHAAIELSMNFLVVIIISLVIFTFGIGFIYKLIGDVTELAEMSEEDIDDQLANLMCNNNDKVCMAEDRANLKNGQVKVFGIKIFNLPEEPYPTANDFFIEITPSIYIDQNNVADSTSTDLSKIEIKPKERHVTIEPNTDQNFGIGFQIPESGVAKGQYIFNLKVYKGTLSNPDNQYGVTQKLYLIVK